MEFPVPKVVYVTADGARKEVQAQTGVSLMETALLEDVPGIVGECGGNMICSTCHVYVAPEWLSKLPAMEPQESGTLTQVAAERKANSRLSCQIRMTEALDGIELHTPPNQ